jgi:uncharacterized membrane protein
MEETAVAVSVDPTHQWALHPVHAVLLASTIPCFLGALLSDIAYSASYQVQWINFASWLIVGGLVFGGFALLWAALGLLRPRGRAGRPLLFLLTLLALWILGFINALVHAKDAWATMPEGLILSAIIALLAVLATWIGFSSIRAGGTR